MASITQLGELLELESLQNYPTADSWFDNRDEINALLAVHLRTKPTADWLSVLEPADIWCADVLDWKRLRSHEGYQVLGMEQTVRRGNGFTYETTRCPIRLNGERIYDDLGSPDIGEHTESIQQEFGL